jgi:putative polymerase
MTFAPRRTWFGCSLVVAAATFNLVLCYLNTHHILAASASTVIVSEIIIIGLAAALSYRFFNTSTLIALLLFVTYFCAMWLITGIHNPKTVRDFLIPVVFFALGYTSAKPEDADKLLYFLIILVLVMALFEWLFLDSFTKMFNIVNYYVAKGAAEETMTEYATANLYGSAYRWAVEADSTLQLFGAHRVSSIFLEPVSMGTFGAASLIWLWLRRKARPVNVLFLAICAFLILLSDSRFAMFSCAILLVADIMPIMRSRMVIFVMPFVIAGMLAFVASMLGHGYVGDDLTGRLVVSGMGLLSLHVADLFGDFGTEIPFIADAGYAYVFSKLGLFGAVALWMLFSASTPRTKEAIRLKTLIAIYVCLALSIGYAFLSIKTSALVWFLYGASRSRRSEEYEQWTFELPERLSSAPALQEDIPKVGF